MKTHWNQFAIYAFLIAFLGFINPSLLLDGPYHLISTLFLVAAAITLAIISRHQIKRSHERGAFIAFAAILFALFDLWPILLWLTI
ncbi:MAG: hypothetical protein AAB417_04055 [Patescibacteria group bacterium]